MRYRPLTVAAALAALLGTAGPALAHGDWDSARRHDRWHQRDDRYHDDWHRSHWRPRYFFGSGYYGDDSYQPYYDYSVPDCHRRSYWDGRW